MSMFRCYCCDVEFDGDYHEAFDWDDKQVCEDCYKQMEAEAKE